MTTHRRHTTTVEPTDTTVGSAVAPSRHLVAVPDLTADDSFGPDGRMLLDQLTRHIHVAHELGVEPLTVVERAVAMLDGACDGWRSERRCTDRSGEPLDAPHPRCLRAQYHHDVLLLEHGLLTTEGAQHER